MKFKAAIFDLDGTLLDTLEDLADSMNSVLTAYGCPPHALEKYKYFVGDGMRNLVKRALPEDMRSDADVQACLSALREEYAKRWNHKTKPYDGIGELLDGLAGRRMKLAVLSNKADHFTKLMIEKLLPDWHFDVVFGERQGVPRKPDPAGALEIASILCIHPKEFIYLGDTGVDMKTAVSAGMYPFGVLWGFRKAEELAENGAKVLLIRPEALLDLL